VDHFVDEPWDRAGSIERPILHDCERKEREREGAMEGSEMLDQFKGGPLTCLRCVQNEYMNE